jgi:DNA-binding XRE family transcriptional regulator
MEQTAFIAAGERLYGKHGWQTQLAETLGMSRATIHRYAKGKLPVPGRVALAMQALEAAR